MKRFIKGVDYEEHEDGRVDFAVEISVDFFKLFGLNYDNLEEEYAHTGFGIFYVRDKQTWFWAIPTNDITYRTRRDKVGSFRLFDSESYALMPNTNLFRELKKTITPMLDKALNKYKREVK